MKQHLGINENLLHSQIKQFIFKPGGTRANQAVSYKIGNTPFMPTNIN